MPTLCRVPAPLRPSLTSLAMPWFRKVRPIPPMPFLIYPKFDVVRAFVSSRLFAACNSSLWYPSVLLSSTTSVAPPASILFTVPIVMHVTALSGMADARKNASQQDKGEIVLHLRPKKASQWYDGFDALIDIQGSSCM